MPTDIYITHKDYSEKPLKLMIKKHMLAGIKYLCKTIEEDHNKYLGSGTHWKKILKEYGTEHIKTRVIFITHSKSEFKRMGTLLSNKWNIVESKDWANKKIEVGDGGFESHTEESRVRMSAVKKGKPKSEEQKAKISAALKGKPKSKEAIAKMSAAKKGKKASPETKAKLSAMRKGAGNNFFGKKHSEESKEKIRATKRMKKLTLNSDHH